MKRQENWAVVKDSVRTRYEVSDLGRCRITDKNTGETKKVYKGYWNKTVQYYYFMDRPVHRWVAEKFMVCDNPEFTEIDHISSDRRWNSVRNLRYTNRKLNNSRLHSKRAKAKTMKARGVQNHRGQVILGNKLNPDGTCTERIWADAKSVALELNCSRPFVYLCAAMEKHSSARTCKGWILTYVPAEQTTNETKSETTNENMEVAQ